jgi:hypothetical protein
VVDVKLNSLTRFFWSLVSEVGEQKAQDLIRAFVGEMNEEVQQFLSDPANVAKWTGSLPEDQQPIVWGILMGIASEAEVEAQKVVDKVWEEAGRINPGDVDPPSPDVDFDGVENSG